MTTPMTEPPSGTPTYIPTPDERSWGMLAHLSGLLAFLLGGMSFLGPLIVWLIKKDQSPFVADQAKEALNFQIALTIAYWVSFATICFVVGLILLPIVIIGSVVFSIMAAME